MNDERRPPRRRPTKLIMDTLMLPEPLALNAAEARAREQRERLAIAAVRAGANPLGALAAVVRGDQLGPDELRRHLRAA
jgi:hypothetical protein